MNRLNSKKTTKKQTRTPEEKRAEEEQRANQLGLLLGINRDGYIGAARGACSTMTSRISKRLGSAELLR